MKNELIHWGMKLTICEERVYRATYVWSPDDVAFININMHSLLRRRAKAFVCNIWRCKGYSNFAKNQFYLDKNVNYLLNISILYLIIADLYIWKVVIGELINIRNKNLRRRKLVFFFLKYYLFKNKYKKRMWSIKNNSLEVISIQTSYKKGSVIIQLKLHYNQNISNTIEISYIVILLL